MPSHAGQVAFPGGRRQASDVDAAATALRETEEEVGIPARFVDVIGAVDLYHTGTGYEITPIVGIVTPGFTVRADPREVADVFEVPLEHFLDEVNHKIDSRQYQGRERRYYAMPYGERYIWGATAGMLKNLHFILTAKETEAASRQMSLSSIPLPLPFRFHVPRPRLGEGEARGLTGGVRNPLTQPLPLAGERRKRQVGRERERISSGADRSWAGALP